MTGGPVRRGDENIDIGQLCEDRGKVAICKPTRGLRRNQACGHLDFGLPAPEL